MSVIDKLADLLSKKGTTFSIEVLPSALVLITITREIDGAATSVGGTYDAVDEGLKDCLSKIEAIDRKRSKLKVIK